MKGKQMVVAFACLMAFLILAEGLALFRMYRSLTSYQNYWTTRAKENGELLYVALGDSAAQGIGASQPRKGYVGLLADRLANKTGKTVQVVNVSKSGGKVEDVLKDQLPAIVSLKPDVVTIEIGANDIASFESKKFEREFTELVAKLPKNTYVTNMPYFGSRPTRRPIALEATKVIERVISKNPRVKLVNLQSITQERDSLRNYAADYFHPNDRAYINWAEAFWKEIDGQL